MGLTGAPPPLPAAAIAANTAVESGTAAVVGILDARGPDKFASSVTEILHAASGPGNIITGRVSELRPDGTLFLTTPSGAELSFRHPPEVSLELGSTITLRLVATVPVPQAVLLAIDGRSVAGLLARATAGKASAATNAATDSLETVASEVTVQPQPGPPRQSRLGEFVIGIATELVATLGREEASRPALAGTTLGDISAAALAQRDEPAIPEPVVAVLVRGAVPRPGAALPALGTRYLLAVQAVSTSADVAGETPVAAPAQPANTPASSSAAVTEPAEGEPAPAPVGPQRATAPVAASPAPIAASSDLQTPRTNADPTPGTPDLTEFTPQTAIVAGRAIVPRQVGEVLVDTALGTLAVPLPDGLVPVGSAVQLKILAVARPLPLLTPGQLVAPSGHAGGSSHAAAGVFESQTFSASSVAASTATSPLVEALTALRALEPALGQAAETLLVLPPGSQLAALIFGFLAGAKLGSAKRWVDSPARAALDAIGRSDLREKLDADAGAIGHQRAPADAEDWAVTVLPYLGVESTRPARLYYRAGVAKAAEEGEQTHAAGQRFVIEIELRRLGPLQFDGLVRERRFDLALRSETPIEPALKTQINAIFRETIGISGYAGELVFGRLARFPLSPEFAEPGGHEISA